MTRAVRAAGFGLVVWALLPVVCQALGTRPARVSFEDVRRIIELLPDHLPPELRGLTLASLEAAWPAWLTRRDGEIRGRVARGTEDSLVNLWLFGTSFTPLPPARSTDIDREGGTSMSAVIEERLADFVAGVGSPGNNERLRYAQLFFAERGLDASKEADLQQIGRVLRDAYRRMRGELSEVANAANSRGQRGAVFSEMAAHATLYKHRGLSSDTSLLSSFAIEATLDALKRSGRLSGPVRRVALVGPGLDVINKAAGHDFYPEQTIQPFTVIDSLVRLELAVSGTVTVTTFDVSPRVNQHLRTAEVRAHEGYVLHLPLGAVDRWTPALMRYWERVGSSIGANVQPLRAPASAGEVRVRAVRIRPDVVRRIIPRDLNIVTERLDTDGLEGPFDLVIATNVLAYYDTFEQSLAIANIGRMLKRGGALLTNQAVLPVPPMQPAVGQHSVTYSDRQFDHIFWYQRQ